MLMMMKEMIIMPTMINRPELLLSIVSFLRTQDKTRAFSVQKTLSSTTAVECVVQSSVFTSFCTVEALNNASHLALWAEVSGGQFDCVRLFRRCSC